jgi:uncharacterized protein YfaS (alpha-2-macroglobulin family)
LKGNERFYDQRCDDEECDVEKESCESTKATDFLEFDCKKALLSNAVLYSKFSKVSCQTVLHFALPQNTSSFRIFVVAFDQKGVYGQSKTQLISKLPFSIHSDYPLFIREGQVLECPVVLSNNRDTTVTAFSQRTGTVVIPPRSKVRSTAVLKYSEVPLGLAFETDCGDRDSLSLAINKVGHFTSEQNVIQQMVVQKDSQPLEVTIKLHPEALPGTATLLVKHVPLSPSVALSGVEHLIKTPYGCFEQTSCTTFPMVLAGLYLKRQPPSDKNTELMLQIDTQIRAGIKRLLSFECKSGGFDWFGTDPGHVTLTAYGIWQFSEMRALNAEYVEQAVIDRSLTWLRNMCEGKGTFKLGSGLDALGKPPQLLSDAFICFVLSDFIKHSINFKHEIFGKIEEYESKPADFTDMYYLSFIGLIYDNLGQKEKARNVRDKVLSGQETNGSFTKSKTSITNSLGKSLVVETTSLALLLLLRFPDSPKANLESAVEFLVSQSVNGYFQSTQGTVLSLKAILEYISSNTNTPSDIIFDVLLDKRKVGRLPILKDGQLTDSFDHPD